MDKLHYGYTKNPFPVPVGWILLQEKTNDFAVLRKSPLTINITMTFLFGHGKTKQWWRVGTENSHHYALFKG